MTRFKFLVLICLAFINSTSAFAYIRSYNGQFFTGEQAIERCEKSLIEINQRFQTHSIVILESHCKIQSNGVSSLITYHQPYALKIEEVMLTLNDMDTCQKKLPEMINFFGKNLLVGFCSNNLDQAIVKALYIRATGALIREYNHSPYYEDEQTCEENLEQIKLTLNSMDIQPFLNSCRKLRKAQFGDEYYYVYSLHYLLPYEFNVSAVEGQKTDSLEECEAGLGGIETDLSLLKLKVIDRYCRPSGKKFVQFLSYKAETLSRSIEKFQSDLIFSDKASCEVELEKLTNRFENNNVYFVIHSYCQTVEKDKFNPWLIYTNNK